MRGCLAAAFALALSGCASVNVPLSTQIELGVGAGAGAAAVAVGAPWWAGCGAAGVTALVRAQDDLIEPSDAVLGAATGCLAALALDRLRLAFNP